MNMYVIYLCHLCSITEEILNLTLTVMSDFRGNFCKCVLRCLIGSVQLEVGAFIFTSRSMGKDPRFSIEVPSREGTRPHSREYLNKDCTMPISRDSAPGTQCMMV